MGASRRSLPVGVKKNAQSTDSGAPIPVVA